MIKCLWHKLDRKISRWLLTYSSRLENKLWRKLYARPRKYCKCITDEEFVQTIKNQFPNKDMFKDV